MRFIETAKTCDSSKHLCLYGIHALALFVSAFVFIAFGNEAFAVDAQPGDEDVSQAIELGIKHKSAPEVLFKGYEFGERGTAVNGYVNTKLFQISHKAAVLSAKGKKVDASMMKDILKQDYLLFPVYLVAGAVEELGEAKVAMRQGTRKIEAAELLEDEPKKGPCVKGQCIWTKDIYAGFYYKDFDTSRLAVIVVAYKGGKAEFPLSLAKFR